MKQEKSPDEEQETKPEGEGKENPDIMSEEFQKCILELVNKHKDSTKHLDYAGSAFNKAKWDAEDRERKKKDKNLKFSPSDVPY